MFSRQQFEAVCQPFARRHPQWTWKDAHSAGYGYLTRTTIHFQLNPMSKVDCFPEPDLEVEADDPAIGETTNPTLTVQEYIVFSAAFRVPTFYFTIHDTNGTPLSLAEIVQTSFFKYPLPEGSETTKFALNVPSTSFPMLSQGEHPTLGTPCWYFHPCQSEAAVAEFMLDIEEEREVRWLELWLMIVGGVLRL